MSSAIVLQSISGRRPRAVGTLYIILRVSWTPLTHNWKEGFPCPQLWFLWVSLWLLSGERIITPSGITSFKLFSQPSPDLRLSSTPRQWWSPVRLPLPGRFCQNNSGAFYIYNIAQSWRKNKCWTFKRNLRTMAFSTYKNILCLKKFETINKKNGFV